MSSLVIGLWGSGEFLPWSEVPDRWLLERARTGDGTVIVLPTASAPEGNEVFERWAQMGVDHYARMGVAVKALPLKTKEDANRPEFVHEMEGASMVYFSGGNPAYLARTLAGSAFWLGLLDGLRRGLAYGGCSAGIAALGEVTGDSASRHLSGSGWQPGLGLFPRTSFGPHWDALDRFIPGLKDVIVRMVPSGGRLLAIDENTAVVGDGTEWSVVGSGAAHLLEDGRWRDFPSGVSFLLGMVAV